MRRTCGVDPALDYITDHDSVYVRNIRKVARNLNFALFVDSVTKTTIERRDILLSTKRTSSGGDVWVCVDRLCRARPGLAVVCPASNEADPLHIVAEFEQPEHDHQPQHQRQRQRQQQRKKQQPFSAIHNGSQSALALRSGTYGAGKSPPPPGMPVERAEEVWGKAMGTATVGHAAAGTLEEQHASTVAARDFSAFVDGNDDPLPSADWMEGDNARYQSGSRSGRSSGGGGIGNGDTPLHPAISGAGCKDGIRATGLAATWNGSTPTTTTASRMTSRSASACCSNSSVGEEPLSRTLPEGLYSPRRQSNFVVFPCSSSSSSPSSVVRPPHGGVVAGTFDAARDVTTSAERASAEGCMTRAEQSCSVLLEAKNDRSEESGRLGADGPGGGDRVENGQEGPDEGRAEGCVAEDMSEDACGSGCSDDGRGPEREEQDGGDDSYVVAGGVLRLRRRRSFSDSKANLVRGLRTTLHDMACAVVFFM